MKKEKEKYNDNDILTWILENGLFSFLIYLAYWQRIDAAYDIMIIISWITIIASFLLLTKKAFNAVSHKLKRPVPAYINMIYDLIVSGIFIWFGNTILGIFWVFQMIIQELTYRKLKTYNNYKEK